MIIRKALNDEIYFPLLNDRNQSQAAVTHNEDILQERPWQR